MGANELIVLIAALSSAGVAIAPPTWIPLPAGSRIGLPRMRPLFRIPMEPCTARRSSVPPACSKPFACGPTSTPPPLVVATVSCCGAVTVPTDSVPAEVMATLLLSAYENSRLPLLTVSASRLFAEFSRLMVPAVDVIASELPVTGPVCVRLPPTVRLPVPMTSPPSERADAFTNETARLPLEIDAAATLFAAFVSVTEPAVAATVSELPTIWLVCVRLPPTLSVMLSAAMPASEKSSTSVNMTRRPGLLTESTSTSFMAVFRSTPPFCVAVEMIVSCEQVIGELLWVNLPPTVSVAVLAVRPTITRSFLSVKETTRPGLLTVSVPTSLLTLGNCTPRAVEVMSSVVAVMEPEAVCDSEGPATIGVPTTSVTGPATMVSSTSSLVSR